MTEPNIVIRLTNVQFVTILVFFGGMMSGITINGVSLSEVKAQVNSLPPAWLINDLKRIESRIDRECK